MIDTYDGLKIGMLVSEAYLNNGTVNSNAIGKEYDLKLRLDLTPQSSNVKNMGTNDDTSVFEVVQTYKQTTEAKIDTIDSVLDDIKANQTNETQKTMIYDGAGNVAEVDDLTNTLQVIPYEHHEIHAGSHFLYTDFDNDVDTGSPKYYRLTTPNTTKWVHLITTLYSDGAGTWQIFENPTVNATGNVATTFNSNRNSTNTAGLVVATDPTSTSDGTLLLTFRTGSGTTNPTRIGSENSRENEIVLKQNEDYFIKFTPDSDNAKIKLGLEWYEHTNN